MPDNISQQRLRALEARRAMEVLTGGKLEPFQVSRIRNVPQNVQAELTSLIAERLIKLEARASKLEKANEALEERLSKLEQKAKSLPRKPRSAEE